jgi:hypothetical protein
MGGIPERAGIKPGHDKVFVIRRILSRETSLAGRHRLAY